MNKIWNKKLQKTDVEVLLLLNSICVGKNKKKKTSNPLLTAVEIN